MKSASIDARFVCPKLKRGALAAPLYPVLSSRKSGVYFCIFVGYHGVMNVITIPKKLAQKGDLVVLPRREYEEFFALRRMMPVVMPSRAELRAIARSEKEIREGKYISWHEFKRKGLFLCVRE